MNKVPPLHCLWNEQKKADHASLCPFCSSSKVEDEIIEFVTEQWTMAVHPSAMAHAALPALTSCISKATKAQTEMQTISPTEPFVDPQAASMRHHSV